MSTISHSRSVLALLALTAAACTDHSAPAPKAKPGSAAGSTSQHHDAGRPAQPSMGKDAGKNAAVAPDAGHASAEEDDAGPGIPERCGSGDCDLLDPTACSDGQGCVFAFASQNASEPRTQCVAVGHGEDGAACSGYADCQPGLDCTTGADAGGAAGNCRRYCCALNSPHGCPAGQFCRIAFEDGHGARPGVFLCDECDGCDVRDEHACGDGKGCYILAGEQSCRVCLPSSGLAPGSACKLNNDCQAGAGCFRTGSESRCLRFCKLSAANCANGATCHAATGISLPPDTGVCL
jgi:hypothetical protein